MTYDLQPESPVPFMNVSPASFAWLRHLMDKRHGAKLAAPSSMEGIAA
jgi:hypothetical protein